MANIITFFRIICSIVLLFVPTFSPIFYILYIAAGISDMLDGFVARKTKTASDFGAGLDSAADAVFVAVCFIRILPCLHIRLWVWIWIAVIACIKAINILSGVVRQRKIIMLHTVANKITGLLLFLMPLFVRWIPFTYMAVPLCAIATFAAIREGHDIRKSM